MHKYTPTRNYTHPDTFVVKLVVVLILLHLLCFIPVSHTPLHTLRTVTHNYTPTRYYTHLNTFVVKLVMYCFSCTCCASYP